jgi:hypothetical protein
VATLDLSESAWRRAKRDTTGVYRSATFSLSVAVLGLLAAAIAGLKTSGHADTETQALVPLAFGLGAVAVGCLAVLVFEVVAAPLRQRDELRRVWVSSDPVDPELVLRDLRRRGRDLLADLGGPDFSLDSVSVETWTSEVVEFLGAHGDREQAERFLDASDGERGLVPALESRLTVLDEIVEAREGSA